MQAFVPLHFKHRKVQFYRAQGRPIVMHQSYVLNYGEPIQPEDGWRICYRVQADGKGAFIVTTAREPFPDTESDIMVMTTKFYRVPDTATGIRAISHHINNPGGSIEMSIAAVNQVPENWLEGQVL